MTSSRTITFLMLGSAFLAASCSTISDDTKALLDKPIDCQTADEDIAALDAALPSTGKRVTSTVRSLAPVAIATGVITRDYRDRARVATGDLSRDINTKIADIYETCGTGEE